MSERPKVQHSKCCVVSQPPWVQIPPLPPVFPGIATKSNTGDWFFQRCTESIRATASMVLNVLFMVACRGDYFGELPARQGSADPAFSLRVLLPVLFFGRGNGNADSRPIWHPLLGSTIQGRVTSPGEVGARVWAKTCYPPKRRIYATYRGRSIGLRTPH